MSAYVEVIVAGNRRAFLEAGSVNGVITSPGGRMDTLASDKAPIAAIMRGGQTVEVISGSPARLLARCAIVRQQFKDSEVPILCDYVDQEVVDDTSKP